MQETPQKNNNIIKNGITSKPSKNENIKIKNTEVISNLKLSVKKAETITPSIKPRKIETYV